MCIPGVLTGAFEKVIAGNPLILGLVRKYYRRLVQREIELAKICCHDTVLFIGGGALPCSAIEIASVTGAKVHVIDIDACAVDKANKLLRALGLDSRITCSMAPGQKVDAGGYTAVVIAVQAVPQDEILANILSTARKNTRILVRRPKHALQSLYASPEGYCCPYCKEVKQSGPTLASTWMFMVEALEGTA